MNDNIEEQEKEYKDLLWRAQQDGVVIRHIRPLERELFPLEGSPYSKKGGYTVAYSRERANSKYLKVAVATCSWGDSFIKKIGNYEALKRYYSGNTISLYKGKLKSHIFISSIFNLMVESEGDGL